MGESGPIAVAFVEVRPDTEDFRSNAEQELRQDLGPDGLPVRSRFELAGLPEARRDVAGLARDLEQATLGGEQLQFEGLEDAAAQSRLLAGALSDAAAVDLEGRLRPAAQAASQLTDQASGLAEALSGIPTEGIGTGLTEGLDSAAADTAALSAASTELSSTLGTTADVASALIARYPQLARAEAQLAAQTARETQQVRLAVAEEERLIRTRARRASSIGPLRLAGVGVGVGVAVFTATRALGDLAEGLRVTGDEAGTTTGKLRNAGAALLQGDVVGIFRSLSNETRSFNLEALKLIANTPKAAQGLRDMGQGANIAKSQLAVLEGLTQVPQFLQTRIAGAQLEGDTGAELSSLERADEVLRDRIETIRSIGLDQVTLNTALEEVFRNRKTIRDEIERITSEARPDILAPLVEAVTDARLTGDSAKILAALRREKAELQKVISAEQTNAEDRRKFKDQLGQVNKDIEATQDAIIAEQTRHRQAMIDRRLAPSEEAILDAEIAGSSTLPALQQRRAEIEEILSEGLINGKKLTRDERVSLKQELAGVNAQIEAAQDAIVSEQQRHADEMSRKRDEADQAFVRGLSLRESRARNQQLVAQASATLLDDIKVSETIQTLLRESIRTARRTIRDAELRAETVAQLQTSLIQEEQSEIQLRAEQRRASVARREESIDLDIQIAQANENIGAEIRAHQAKISFLRERIRHTREGTNQRKRLILEIRQEQAAIRDLREQQNKERDESRASFKQMAFEFLQEQAGFVSNLAGNLLPSSLPRPQTATTLQRPPAPVEPTLAQRPPVTRRDIVSPFERAAARGVTTQAEAAAQLREQGGAPATAGQVSELITIGRSTNRILARIANGVTHGEAQAARALSRNVTQVGVD